MVKLGKTRQKEGAKETAKDRADSPRALKKIIVSTHEDGSPHIIRTYRVHVADETVKVFDRELNEHTIEAKKGELDWSRGSTVGEQIFMPGAEKPVAIISLSHDKQYSVQAAQFTVFDKKLNRRRASRTDFKAERVEFSGWTVKSPNAWVPRFNIFNDEPAEILNLWQMEADSPDAKWVDGKAPTLEDLAANQKEYEEKKAARKARKLTGAATGDNSGGPKGADDMGDDF